MIRNKNEQSMEDAAIKLVANAFVEKEGEKIIQEAKKINQVEQISEEEVAEFERFCNKKFAKQERKEKFYHISKVAVAVFAVLVFVSGVYQFSLTYMNPVVDEKGTTTMGSYSEDYIGDTRLEYAPTYIPRKLTEYDVDSKKNMTIVNYCFNEKKVKFFYCLKEEKTSDNNNDNFKQIDINGAEAKVTSKPSEDIVKIEWEKGNHILCVEGQGVDEKEVIKIARSVQRVKED